MFDLTGRKALVTGATGGIGEEIARALHARGAIVGLHGTRREKLEQLAADLGEGARIFTANLTDRAAVRDLAKAAGLSTLLAVGAELIMDDDDRLVQAIRNGAQDTINDAGQQIIQRQLQVPPTLTIRPGFPMRVIVTRDLVLEPYRG